MTLTIEQVANGYILRSDDPDELAWLIEDMNDPVDAARKMLWQVNETIGYPGSRYDEWRVSIRLDHGDKWMSPEEIAEMRVSDMETGI